MTFLIWILAALAVEYGAMFLYLKWVFRHAENKTH